MLGQGKQGSLTFQDIARGLPPDKLRRLGEIKRAYPHISLDRLPDGVKQEVQGILQSGINTTPARQRQTAQIRGVGLPPHHQYNRLFSVIGTDLASSEDVPVYQKDRTQGLYIIGTTGTGKSTLLANLILTDINQGLGVCLIEPHGDLTNTVLAGIPDSRLSDVIYLDMTDSEYPFGLNLFQCPEPRTITAMAKTASFVHHVFEKLWGAGTETPRLMHVLRAITRTLMENPGTTFAEIPLLFGSDTARAKMAANVSNSSIISFWKDFALKSPSAREVYIESVKNKVMSFLDEPMVRNIVAQSETTINFRTIMDEGKILLVKLSPQFKEVSERFIKTDWFPLPPRFYQGFKKSASALGHPDFVRQESVDKFLASLRYKDKDKGSCVVDMITELRYTMQILAQQPILVDTGQYKPKYQDRTYADMENEIASRLTQQANFQAKAKVLSGEHDIKTKGMPRNEFFG